jgi:trehalose-phosphatase
MNGIDPALLDRLQSVARMPVLLVASDYDGTVAPIVSDPSAALPDREAVTALRALATLPNTHAAVVSGRALRDLASLSRLPQEVHLAGSHGAEFDLDFARALPREQRQLLDEVCARLHAVAAAHPGTLVEVKPASAAFHFRMAEDPAPFPDVVLRAVEGLPVGITRGKAVVEVAVVPTDKGAALDRLRHDLGAAAVVFVGDDVTDESAFVRLGGPDVGIKVGPGESAAAHRVDDTRDVCRVLATLVELRREWLTGGAVVPIEQHSFLSSGRTNALLTPAAEVTWWCAPTPDAAAIFASLLGGQSAGTWSIAAGDGSRPVTQRYRGDTLMVETRWPSFTVLDYLVSRDPAAPDGRSDDLVRVIHGSGRVQLAFRPRFDFGRVPTGLRVVPGGLVVTGTRDAVFLSSPGVTWTIVEEGAHHAALAELDLGHSPDEPLVLALRWGSRPMPLAIDEERATRERERNRWESWAAGLRLPARAPDLVLRSALILKGLVYEPTGAVLAAATTSLPECFGGSRNWDYRYCWIRDAAFSVTALARLGSVDEGLAFLEWLGRVLDELDHPGDLRPLYTVSGTHLAPEAVIAELSGYGGSRPVRIGNAADSQLQIDVFGPVVDLAHLLCEAGAESHVRARWPVVEHVVDAVAARWDDDDHGIWEQRLTPRPHVNSRAMSWLAVDRAVRIGERLGLAVPDDWRVLRDRIHADVMANGVSAATGGFGVAYGSDDVDAALLLVGLSGMLPATDPRVLATIHEVEVALRSGPAVYRYRFHDGLPGHEGGFNICTGWLIQAFAGAGRYDDAADLFTRFVDLVGPTGVMAEEYDPDTGRALGNVPQAYSHLAIIDAAVALERARRRGDDVHRTG